MLSRHPGGNGRSLGDRRASARANDCTRLFERIRQSDTGLAIAGDLLEYVEHAPLAIAVIDLEAHVLRYANLTLRQLGEGEDEPLLDSLLKRAFSATGADLVTTLLEQVRQSGEPQTDVELELPTGGEPVAWSFDVWPTCSMPGMPGDVVLQARDITHEHREHRVHADAVEQLRAVNERLLINSLHEQELTDRAEAANEAKSVFLATMSHELRTPLTAIIGYEELLADGITGPVSEAQREQLARIKRSATHLLTLIDQVLTLAKVEAGREDVQRVVVSITELVDWATTLVAPLAAAKNLAFGTHLPDTEVLLCTDSMKVRQILINLLGNAVKFTDQGEIALTVRDDHGVACFEVSDSGVGISPADAERVFDAFWQVEQRATRRVGGSGLGLSVSRRLARLLGGDICVESEKGRGSTFTLRLPCDGSPAPVPG